MCGIAGLIGSKAGDLSVLDRMGAKIHHRGPDAPGVWNDPAAQIALVHRRLAIIDLSSAGAQPMSSADGRWVLCYNGEVYNHLDLRRELEEERPGIVWRGHSDTETLIECVSKWGLMCTLERSVGMFALALWDRRDRKLHLARDRFGEKPLYYGWSAGQFVFASELKAIRAVPEFDNGVDRRALALFAARNYVPAPMSIYRDLYKLQPGCVLTVSPAIVQNRPSWVPAIGAPPEGTTLEPFWSYQQVVNAGLANPFSSEQEAIEQLEEAFAQAIRGQAVADVPVGAFLSGGIDSSLVVAMYHKHTNSQVRTFSIGFNEAGFNEAEYAKAVAAHFGTEHHEHYVTDREAQAVLPLLPTVYDEPFADSSQIPTYLVSAFAREQVTVALSGDGGDELFGGYNRYFAAGRAWKRLSRVSKPVRRLVGATLGMVPSQAWDSTLALLPGPSRSPHLGAKIQKGFRTIGASDELETVFGNMLDEWAGEAGPVVAAPALPSATEFDLGLAAGASDIERMMYCDARSYMVDDILVKVDRAAMAVSLETRVPFLDHRVAAVAARIPIEMKIKGGSGKQALRKLLYREAPEALFDRPKAGFGVPVGEWIRGPLRPWAESLLNKSRLAQDGWFDYERVTQRWRDHLAGRRDATASIWSVLMFNAWVDTTLAEDACHSARAR